MKPSFAIFILALFVLFCGLSFRSDTQAQSNTAHSGTWTLQSIKDAVFRLNTATGETYVLRGTETDKPYWLKIRDNASGEQALSIWDAILENGKSVVDASGKVLGIQLPDNFKNNDSELVGGDIITKVDDQSISAVTDVRQALRAARNAKKSSVIVTFLRGEQSKSTDVKLPQ